MSNEDLDIPSQKRMHGAFRCEKIRHDVLQQFNEKVPN